MRLTDFKERGMEDGDGSRRLEGFLRCVWARESSVLMFKGEARGEGSLWARLAQVP